MTARAPARLHVLLARKAPIGLVWRRGPARSVAAIAWDRKRDTFALGQWLRGRIYERRSDLSPDGRHVIYFAMNGHWKSRGKGAWTAISRAPYLHAIALLAKGDCWNGGGLFVDDKRYWLNDGYGHEIVRETREVARAMPSPYRAEWGGECPGVYYNRLQRDGWTLRRELAPDGKTDVFDRELGAGWTLRKLAHAGDPPPGNSIYYDTHALVHADGRVIPRDDWEWADVDRGRLVWAAGGALHTARLRLGSPRADDPLVGTALIHDFNDMRFEARAAPYK